MAKVALSEAVALIRAELLRAMAVPDDSGVKFPVGQITLSFQVGLTTSGGASAGAQLWVLELGAEGSYAKETVQGVTIVLEPPVTADGAGIKIAVGTNSIPG